MAEDLTTMLTDGAQSEEDVQRLAGNVQDPTVVDPNAAVDNPDGSSTFGAATDNTITEQAPATQPPAVDVSATIAEPATYDTGGSGDVVIPPPQTTETSTSTAPELAVLATPQLAQSVPDIPAVAPQEQPPAPNPSLSIAKTVDGVYQLVDGQLVQLDQATVTQAGQVVGYLITVANTGDQGLTSVVVTDPLANYGEITLIGGDLDSDGVLDIGETWVYQAYHLFSQAEIDAGGNLDSDLNGFFDQFSNTATVDSDQTGESQSSASIIVIQTPDLTVTKQANVDSVDEPGDVIVYTLTASNTGNQTLTNIIVTDPLTNFQSSPLTLSPGQTVSFLVEYSVTQLDIDNNGGGDGDIDNIVTAISDKTAPISATYEVIIVRNPDLSISKSADVSEVSEPGDVIVYTLTVANEGNATLTNVIVTDPLTNFVSNPITLVPGQSASFQVEYIVTQLDIDSNGGGDGDIDNIATADSSETDPTTASYEVLIARDPVLSLTKSADVSEVTEAGEVVVYTLTVTNEGNVTLTNVVVVDPLTGFQSEPITLAPGQSFSYQIDYQVTDEDIATDGGGDGDIDNTATADSSQTAPTSASYEVDIVRNPDITIVKSGVVTQGTGDSDQTGETSDRADTSGDRITYTVNVGNVGNSILTNVKIVDALFADAVDQDPETAGKQILVSLGGGTSTSYLTVQGSGANSYVVVPSIAVGATAELTYEYIVTQADINDKGGGDGDIDNTASVTSDQTLTPETDSWTIPLLYTPDLTVEKTGVVSKGGVDHDQNSTTPEIADGASDEITYTVKVANVGNATLTKVQIVDALFADAVDQDPETAGKQILVSLDGGTSTSYLTVQGSGAGSYVVVPSIAVGATAELTYEYIVTQADINDKGGGDGNIDNTASVTSDQTLTPETDSWTIPLLNTPDLTVEKTGVVSKGGVDHDQNSTTPEIADGASDEITYTVKVANVGNATLTKVQIVDALFADAVDQDPETAGKQILVSLDGGTSTSYLTVQGSGAGSYVVVPSIAVGATAELTYEYIVTQADINDKGGGDGDIDNTASVTSDQTLTPETDSWTIPLLYTPDLTVEKTGVVSKGGVDHDQNSTTPEIADGASDEITYTVKVANVGNATLTKVQIVDALFADAVDQDPETAGKQILVSLDGGTSTSYLTVQGSGAGSYVVVPSIAVGATAELTYEYIVTQADINDKGGGDGDIDNTASVTSDQTLTPETDSWTIPLLYTPDLTVEKTGVVSKGGVDHDQNSTTPEIADGASDEITYTVKVANVGNATLTKVQIVDALFADAVDQDPETAGKQILVSLDGGTSTSYLTVQGSGAGSYVVVPSIAVGATAELTYEYIVTQADINDKGGGDGDIDNTASVTSDQTLTPETDSWTIPLLYTPDLTVEKTGVVSKGGVDHDQNSTTPEIADGASDEITYTVKVANVGNATLTKVQIVDALFADAVDQDPETAGKQILVSLDGGTSTSYLTVQGSGAGSYVVVPSIAVGATAELTYEYIVTQADINDKGGGDGDIDNTASVTSDQTLTPETDSWTIPLLYTPDLTVEKTGVVSKGGVDHDQNSTTPEIADGASDEITYTVKVANVGNATLTKVQIVDALFADAVDQDPETAGKQILVSLDGGTSTSYLTVQGSGAGSYVVVPSIAVGATAELTYEYIVTQADINDKGGGDGDIDNTASVTSDQTLTPETDSWTIPLLYTPDLTVEKTGVVSKGGVDHDQNSTTPEIADGASDEITYTVKVANVGNATLTKVQIVDALFADAVDQDPETAGKQILVSLDGGTSTSYLTVQGSGAGSYVVVPSIAVGATAELTYEYIVTQADINDKGGGDGDIDNTASVTSDQTLTPETDSWTIPLLYTPDLTVEKTGVVSKGGVDHDQNSTTPEIADGASDEITYTVKVANVGNATLTKVQIVDALFADAVDQDPETAGKQILVSLDGGTSTSYLTVQGSGAGSYVVVPSIAVGATAELTYEYIVTQADINDKGGGDGDIDNTASVTSDQTLTPETDSWTIPLLYTPEIQITKVADVASVSNSGQEVKYTITVTNTGNSDLTNIVVTDPLLSALPLVLKTGSDIGGNNILSVGETWTYEGVYIVTKCDVYHRGGGDGDIDNTASVVSDQTTLLQAQYSVLLPALLDEDNLENGNACGKGDIAAGLTYVWVLDGEIANFSAMNAVSVAAGQETISFTWDAVSKTLTANVTDSPDALRIGAEVFSLVVDESANGIVTVTASLDSNFLHETPGTEDNILLNLAFTLDGSARDLFVTINDDTPKLFFTELDAAGDPVSPPITGDELTLHMNELDSAQFQLTASYGADGSALPPLTAFGLSNFESLGLNTGTFSYANLDYNQLTGEYTFDVLYDPDASGSAAAFVTSQYTVNLTTGEVDVVVSNQYVTSYDFRALTTGIDIQGAGPQPLYILDSSIDTITKIIGSDGDAIFEETADTVNSKDGSYGVGAAASGQNIGYGETITFQFLDAAGLTTGTPSSLAAIYNPNPDGMIDPSLAVPETAATIALLSPKDGFRFDIEKFTGTGNLFSATVQIGYLVLGDDGAYYIRYSSFELDSLYAPAGNSPSTVFPSVQVTTDGFTVFGHDSPTDTDSGVLLQGSLESTTGWNFAEGETLVGLVSVAISNSNSAECLFNVADFGYLSRVDQSSDLDYGFTMTVTDSDGDTSSVDLDVYIDGSDPGGSQPSGGVAAVTDSVGLLVDDYLCALSDSDSQDDFNVDGVDGFVIGDIVYGIDQLVSAYLADHALTSEAYDSIEQQVLGEIVDHMGDLGLDVPAPDSSGNYDLAAVTELVYDHYLCEYDHLPLHDPTPAPTSDV